MEDVKMPHEGHEEHLCYAHSMGMLTENPEEYKRLVKDAKYFCMGCGRAAASDKNLCVPAPLDSSD